MSGLSHMSFMDALRVAAQTKEAPREWGAGSDSLARTPSWPAGLSEASTSAPAHPAHPGPAYGSSPGAEASPKGGPAASKSPLNDGCAPGALLSRPGSAAGSRKRQWGTEGEGAVSAPAGGRVLQRGVSENFRSTQGLHKSPLRNSHGHAPALNRGSQASQSYRERSPMLGQASEMPQPSLAERSPLGGACAAKRGERVGGRGRETSQSYKERSPELVSARERFPRNNSTPTSATTPCASSSSYNSSHSNASSIPSPVPSPFLSSVLSSGPSSPSIPSNPAAPLRACHRSLSLPRSSLDGALTNPAQYHPPAGGPTGGSGTGAGMSQGEKGGLLKVPSTQSLPGPNYPTSSCTPPRFRPCTSPLPPSLQCTPPRPPPCPAQPPALVHPGLTLTQGHGPQQLPPPPKRRKPFDLSWISAVAGSFRTPWAGRRGPGAPDGSEADAPLGTPLGGPPASTAQPQIWRNNSTPLPGTQASPMFCSPTPNGGGSNDSTPTGTPVRSASNASDAALRGNGYSAVGTPPSHHLAAPGIQPWSGTVQQRQEQQQHHRRSPPLGSHPGSFSGGFSGNAISASGSREAPSLPSLPEVYQFQWGPDSLGTAATLTTPRYAGGGHHGEGRGDGDDEGGVFRRACTDPSMRHAACSYAPLGTASGMPSGMPHGAPTAMPNDMFHAEGRSGPMSDDVTHDSLASPLPAWTSLPTPEGATALGTTSLEDILSGGGAYAAMPQGECRQAERLGLGLGMGVGEGEREGEGEGSGEGEGEGEPSEPWSGAGPVRLGKSPSDSSSEMTPPPQPAPAGAYQYDRSWESDGYTEGYTEGHAEGYAGAPGVPLKAAGSLEEVGSCAWAAAGAPADNRLVEGAGAGGETASALDAAFARSAAPVVGNTPTPTAAAAAAAGTGRGGADGRSEAASTAPGVDGGPTIEVPARRLADVDDAQIEALAAACMDSLALLVPPRHAGGTTGGKPAPAPSPGAWHRAHLPSPSASRRGVNGPFAPLIIPSPSSTFSPSAAFAWGGASGAPFGAPFVSTVGTPAPPPGAPAAAGAPRRPAPLVIDPEGVGSPRLPEGALDLCGNSPQGGVGLFQWGGNLPTPNMTGAGGPASPWGEAWSEGFKAELPSPSPNSTRLW